MHQGDLMTIHHYSTNQILALTDLRLNNGFTIGAPIKIKQMLNIIRFQETTQSIILKFHPSCNQDIFSMNINTLTPNTTSDSL